MQREKIIENLGRNDSNYLCFARELAAALTLCQLRLIKRVCSITNWKPPNMWAAKRKGVAIREEKILSPHSNTTIFLFFWFLSPVHNQGWFPPNRKTSLFPLCLRLSAILCGPGLNSACGQKYPPMAPLDGTGRTDHRHTALKIQSKSATAPRVHSLASSRLGRQQRQRRHKVMQCWDVSHTRCGKTMAA